MFNFCIGSDSYSTIFATLCTAFDQAVFIPTDVTDRAQLEAACAIASTEHGGVDISCACVGHGPRVTFLDERCAA